MNIIKEGAFCKFPYMENDNKYCNMNNCASYSNTTEFEKIKVLF